MLTVTKSTPRPTGFEDRYRLYIDESGDHVFRDITEPAHRFLCLLGCWFRNPEYMQFYQALEALKMRHFPHHPDEPVVLHREDMLNARQAFKVLRDPTKRSKFDAELIEVIREAEFRVVAVVIDKAALYEAYGDAAAHPYHLGLGFMLQRFAGYLNHINRMGDVMAEARGGTEDRLLAGSYTRIYSHGVWVTPASTFQSALTSKELKLKQKNSNIAGLQLADLIGNPAKRWILKRQGLIEEDLGPFAQRLMEIIEPKLNRHLYNGRIDGYGIVLFPKK